MRFISFLAKTTDSNWIVKLRDGDIIGYYQHDQEDKVMEVLNIFNLKGKKAVITGRTPAILEYFVDRENIFLCEGADADSLANAIMLLKDNEELRIRIAENGYKLIQENFTSELIGREVKEILSKTLV